MISRWRAALLASALLLGLLPAAQNRAAANPPSNPANPGSANAWRRFEPVVRPEVPKPSLTRSGGTPIDAFVAFEREKRGLHPQRPASKEVLLKRVYLDLIGLLPTPAEQERFLEDASPGAYEAVVERLLDSPRYGERWARHWMDIWRYSDWAGWSGGNQIRDSKPHIWRWRDWIIESLNADKGYDQMVLEMLAADEAAPGDTNAVRATGFLVRNFKLLSREQWLDDTVKHTSQAFLGLTMGCAKCHDHMYDPIRQEEYYRLRAVFEPHQVRTDQVPGETDTAKDGLVRVYDTATNRTTWFYERGDERRADTNRLMRPGVPKVLQGPPEFTANEVPLPKEAAFPAKRDFVIRDLIAAHEKASEEAAAALETLQRDGQAGAGKVAEQELKLALARAKQTSLLETLRAEQLEDSGGKETPEWKQAASAAAASQRREKVCETRLKLQQARAMEGQARSKLKEAEETPDPKIPAVENGGKGDKEPAQPKGDKANKAQLEKLRREVEGAAKKTTEAETALASAEKAEQAEAGTDYTRRPGESYPATSSGRRLAFARWLTDRKNPLTARVAMNHLWLRHFGRGIVATPADLGRNGSGPSHPQLLDWLAAEFMARDWRMKAMHRLIVTSDTYRMAAFPDESNTALDPDNIYLWRMPSRRMEAETVRDNLLYLAGDLDSAMGGPEVDHNQGLTSKRRSIYLRNAAEKEVEFLKIFDGPSVTECYQRHSSVMPQQALALANSELALREARKVAAALNASNEADSSFVGAAFRSLLARGPTAEEANSCLGFLKAGQKETRHADPALRARENLVLVLFNHNDFITIR